MSAGLHLGKHGSMHTGKLVQLLPPAQGSIAASEAAAPTIGRVPLGGVETRRQKRLEISTRDEYAAVASSSVKPAKDVSVKYDPPAVCTAVDHGPEARLRSKAVFQ
jgi:hypothetical protein